MNKTLLLILCDFLLLTLLALTRWETVAEPPRAKQPPVPELAANAVTKEQDLVELMRQSLADERSVRDEIAAKLAAADAALVAREQSLSQVQSERSRIADERNAVAATLNETQRAAADLNQKFSTATQEVSMTKEQLVQLQRELAEKQAEAERQRQALAKLERQQAEARKQIEGLTLAVVVSEQEKKTLRETATTLKGQVEVERTERAKVQEVNTKLAQASTQLAQGVGQLVERSGELTKEIREHRPVNANVIFNEFTANRVNATFAATRRGFLRQAANRTKEGNTVLVTDGQQVFALLHIGDTVFALGDSGVDWESLTVELVRGGNRVPAAAVQFLTQDPRLTAIPLTPAQVKTLNAKVYPLAADPFRFPDAVLIDGGGRGYGEVSFKLEPTDPGFVRVDNRLFKRMFGDFAPKRGDLVFAKTGELLGIMVNSDFCALLSDLKSTVAIRTGTDIREQATGALFDDLIARVRSMPLKLQ